ncbi:MAG: hypothetical protein FJ095_10855 [Deltaproteobacteria bacterium]|nr:hypothetical protein [Deltaproteobacteria bacterium]
MSESGVQRLGERARELEAEGAEPLRLEAIQRARKFKRSWLEMAETLTEIRRRHRFEAWGYADLHAYAAEELGMKRATVDKLTGSYHTVERYAPELLKRDADEARLPPLDSVDYLARALGERGAKRAEAAPPEVLDQLKDAVFEEVRPLTSIRREFHATLFPKSETERANELAERTRAQVRRLLDALTSVDGLDPNLTDESRRVLERLEVELTSLASPLPEDAALRA